MKRNAFSAKLVGSYRYIWI